MNGLGFLALILWAFLVGLVTYHYALRWARTGRFRGERFREKG